MKQSTAGIGIVLVGLFVLCIAFTPLTVAAHNDSHSLNGTEDSIEPTPDQQFETIVGSTFADIEGEVDTARRNAAVEGANSSAERAEVLKEQADELTESSQEISEEYREAAREREQGKISQEEFAQRVAVLHTRAERTQSEVARVEGLTTELPQAALDNARISHTQFETANESITVVASSGASVIREKFTGNDDVTNLSVTGSERGLSVAAEASDGRVFRGVERKADDDESYNMSEQKALALARSELSGGDWSVSDSEADDGTYEFEFEKVGNQSSGEAEITVDASSEQVIKTERSERRGPPAHAGGPPEDARGPPATVPGADNRNENAEDRPEGPEHEDAENPEDEEERGDQVETYNITESEARSIALANLSETDWNQTEVEREDGDYRFEFVRGGTGNASALAKIDVDASASVVVEKEVETDQSESEAESEAESEEREEDERDGETETREGGYENEEDDEDEEKVEEDAEDESEGE